MHYLIMSSVNICLHLLQVPSIFLEFLKDFLYFYLYVSVGGYVRAHPEARRIRSSGVGVRWL